MSRQIVGGASVWVARANTLGRPVCPPGATDPLATLSDLTRMRSRGEASERSGS